MRIRIVGTGRAVPAERVTTRALEARLGLEGLARPLEDDEGSRPRRDLTMKEAGHAVTYWQQAPDRRWERNA